MPLTRNRRGGGNVIPDNQSENRTLVTAQTSSALILHEPGEAAVVVQIPGVRQREENTRLISFHENARNQMNIVDHVYHEN